MQIIFECNPSYNINGLPLPHSCGGDTDGINVTMNKSMI
jgi:hypothetical protein